jgi:PadR family transcriptional regulator PadR
LQRCASFCSENVKKCAVNVKSEGGIVMAVDRSLVSGSTTMLLLKLLSEKDMYGYEMIETLREKSQNVFELKAGTLYPLLHGMEDKKYLTVYEKEVGGKVRKYYSITKTGRKVLEEKKEEWKIYSSAVVNVLNAAVC